MVPLQQEEHEFSRKTKNREAVKSSKSPSRSRVKIAKQEWTHRERAQESMSPK